MNKIQAVDLLNQIIVSCQSLSISGFYTHPMHADPEANVELRLITTLDVDSRRRISSILSSRGLKIEEDKGLVIIYEPTVLSFNS
jgi:hypothetical protein